jgi:hypothetical protein
MRMVRGPHDTVRPARDRGASVQEYGAALLLVGGIVVLVTGYVPNVISVKTRSAICRVFQSTCDEEIPANSTARNRPNPVVPLARQTQPNARRTPPAPTRRPPPGGQARGGPSPPTTLTPELLTQYQMCEREIPADFEEIIGYAPECVDTPYGRRAIDVEGSCSVPVINPALGNHAMGFDFSYPCLTHDLAYDLMRYYNRKYDTHDPQGRIMADKQFTNDLHAYCDTQGSGLLAYYERSACRDAANNYAGAVQAASARDGNGRPN